MIFISYTDQQDKVTGFAVDFIATYDTISIQDEAATLITLVSGREIELMISVNDFEAKVFTDENMQSEYAIVEIEDPRPKVVWEED